MSAPDSRCGGEDADGNAVDDSDGGFKTEGEDEGGGGSASEEISDVERGLGKIVDIGGSASAAVDDCAAASR